MVDTVVFERIPPPVFGKENKMDPSGQHSPNVGAGFIFFRYTGLPRLPVKFNFCILIFFLFHIGVMECCDCGFWPALV